MNLYKNLLATISLVCFTSSLTAMETKKKKLKQADGVTIELKKTSVDGNREEITISSDLFDRFKNIIGIKDIVEHDIEKQGSLDLSYLDVAQFELILNNLEAIEAESSEGLEKLLVTLDQKDRK